MQLTGFTDISLRVLMRVAVLDEGESTTAGALADQLNVSRAHVAKVVTTLGGLGVLDTWRGRYGGLRLADGARSISIGLLVRRLEGGPGDTTGHGKEVVECEGANPCPLRTGCRLRVALRDAQEAFYAALDPLTVADVTTGPARSVLLSIGRTVA